MFHFAYVLGEELLCGLIAMGLTVVGAIGYAIYVTMEAQKEKKYLQNLKMPDAIPRCPKCGGDLRDHLNDEDRFSAFKEMHSRTVVCDCLLVSKWDTLGSIPALIEYRGPTPEEVKRHQETQVWRRRQKEIQNLTQAGNK